MEVLKPAIHNPKSAISQSILLLVLAVLLGLVRQSAPHGIRWNGQWPTEKTSALAAYEMMAEENDPPFVSLQETIQAQQKKSAILLDARASEEFQKGFIPGARNLPYYEIEEYQAKALDGVQADTPVIIYCEGVGCELSFFLGRELQEGGYTNIGIFYGGYPEWEKAGLRIQK